VRFCYLDASALAKRYAPEPGTPLVNYLFHRVPLDRMYVFNVGIGEVMSMLVRKRNGGLLAAAAFNQAVIDFGVEIVNQASVRKVMADNALVNASLPLIQAHAVNATDALILRSAMDLAVALRATGHDLLLVASDLRLLTASQAEGLAAFNPERETQTDLDALLTP
jgi:hypothetical protein